ncbi:hypothetical protein ACJIZ3_010751 [Penstemon smallii]|uniref:Photosystem II protein I n=1 Tax=Penstemon smallii TaxID=265156 RepID=A0ABD3UH60_9LAMI
MGVIVNSIIILKIIPFSNFFRIFFLFFRSDY